MRFLSISGIAVHDPQFPAGSVAGSSGHNQNCRQNSFKTYREGKKGSEANKRKDLKRISSNSCQPQIARLEHHKTQEQDSLGKDKRNQSTYQVKKKMTRESFQQPFYQQKQGYGKIQTLKKFYDDMKFQSSNKELMIGSDRNLQYRGEAELSLPPSKNKTSEDHINELNKSVSLSIEKNSPNESSESNTDTLNAFRSNRQISKPGSISPGRAESKSHSDLQRGEHPEEVLDSHEDEKHNYHHLDQTFPAHFISNDRKQQSILSLQRSGSQNSYSYLGHPNL